MHEIHPDTTQVLLDSGGLSDRPTPDGDVKTRGLVEAMNRLGYRVSNVGERDLTMGYDAFRSRTDHAKFPFISTNIVRKDTGKPVFEPYHVVQTKTRDGKPFRIGVLGVARYNPVFLKSGPDGSNLVIRNPKEAIAERMEALRAETDYIVLLAALAREDAVRIVREVPGIDLVIGAYGGVYTTREEREGDTLVVYSGNQGKRIGETRLYVGGDRDVESTSTYLYYLTSAYPGEPDWVEYVNDVLARASSATGAQAAASEAR